MEFPAWSKYVFQTERSVALYLSVIITHMTGTVHGFASSGDITVFSHCSSEYILLRDFSI